MEEMTTAAGLAALGFWLFVAAVVAVGVWDGIRKRDAQHETLRRIIESGQSIDPELTDKLLLLTGGSKDASRDLMVSGLILLFVAPGLLILGWVLSSVSADVWVAMLGVSGLIACISIGLLIAGFWLKRQGDQDDGSIGTLHRS
ncbi:MAG: DUF6249 domain-containing protein [Pseudomonadales bacterium]